MTSPEYLCDYLFPFSSHPTPSLHPPHSQTTQQVSVWLGLGFGLMVIMGFVLGIGLSHEAVSCSLPSVLQLTGNPEPQWKIYKPDSHPTFDFSSHENVCAVQSYEGHAEDKAAITVRSTV